MRSGARSHVLRARNDARRSERHLRRHAQVVRVARTQAFHATRRRAVEVCRVGPSQRIVCTAHCFRGRSMKIAALIPARMGSSRFPGKPLAHLLGRPMIGHVYERVRRNPLLTLTAVATCDPEIFDYVQSIGGRAVMTGSHHERASDRCAEALGILEAEERITYDIVV